LLVLAFDDSWRRMKSLKSEGPDQRKSEQVHPCRKKTPKLAPLVRCRPLAPPLPLSPRSAKACPHPVPPRRLRIHLPSLCRRIGFDPRKLLPAPSRRKFRLMLSPLTQSCGPRRSPLLPRGLTLALPSLRLVSDGEER
jgi:hypothetical protein